MRHGEGRHYSDLKSRLGAFVAAAFGERYADTVTRSEILSYVKGGGGAPRTMRNHKTAICEFFNWLVQENEVAANPAAGIKKRMLPKAVSLFYCYLTWLCLVCTPLNKLNKLISLFISRYD